MANQNLSTRTNAGASVAVVPGTSDGLVSKNGVPGNTTGTAIAAGYVGETVYGPSNKTASLVTAGSTGTWFNVQSISIPGAGVWSVITNCQLKPGDNSTVFSLTTSSDFQISTSATPSGGSGIAGSNAGFDYTSMFFDNSQNASGKFASATLVCPYVATAACTLYVHGNLAYTGTAPRMRAGMIAVRIA